MNSPSSLTSNRWYVRRSVVTTSDVESPMSRGLTIKCSTWSEPAPDIADSTDHRVESPTLMCVTTSPGCSSMSVTCKIAHTIDGNDSPNLNSTELLAPGCPTIVA